MNNLNNEESSLLWDNLHAQPRFRPRYPSDHVLRFLMRSCPTLSGDLKAIDIGTGAGRHTKLFCDFGLQAYGVDFSIEGIRHCEKWLESTGQSAILKHGEMSQLPFDSNFFDIGLSFGVFYYTNAAGMQKAVAELHRVLKPGGRALVVIRTDEDYRYGKGKAIEPDTFQLRIDDTNELGSTQHFVRQSQIKILFSMFSAITFEKTETTFYNLQAKNSDWLIELQK